MLVADIPHTEQSGGNHGQHDDDHDPLDVNGIPDMSALGGHCRRNPEEGVKGIPCRMQPPQLTAFFKKAWFYCVFFHSDNPLSHFLDHEVDSLGDDSLDVVL